ELDALVATMLAKAPEDRPADGYAAAAALEAILEGVRSRGAPAPRSTSTRLRLTEVEQRVLSLVVAQSGGRFGPAAPPLPIALAETRARALRATAERYRGRLDVLADGSPLIAFPSVETATDMAIRAARCALAIRPLLGEAPIAIVTGRAALSAGLPAGELI